MKAFIRTSIMFFVSLLIFTGSAWAELTIDNYTLVSSKRVSRVEYVYTYKANVINTDNVAHNVSAQVVSSSPHTVIVERMLNFGNVGAGTTTQSMDTFTIRHNRRYPLDWDALSWKLQFIDLTENTIVVDQTINAALQMVDEDVLIFDRYVDLALGTVLVFGPSEQMPQGALRKVIDIYDTGTGIVVYTAQASLTEAIENCHIDITHEIDPNNIEFAQIADGVIFTHNSPFDFVTDNFPFHDDIGIDVHLNITVGYNIEIDITGASISLFRFTANVIENAELSMQVNADVNFDQYEEEMGKIDMFHHTIMVGGFPVVIDSNLFTSIGVNGSASAQMQQEINQQATYEAGVEYRNGDWNIISDFNKDIVYSAPSDVSAELQAYIKATVDLRLYGVAGPFVINKIYSDLNASCANDPFLLWNYGLSVQPGVSVKISGETIDDLLGINWPWSISWIPDLEFIYSFEPIILFEDELFSIEDSPICDMVTFNLEYRYPISQIIKGISLSPDDSTLYVAYWTDTWNDRVEWFSAKAPYNFIDYVAYGRCHGDVGVSSNNRYIFTTTYYSDNVSRFDLWNNKAQTPLPTTSWPQTLSLTPDRSKMVVFGGMDGRDYDMGNDALHIFDISNDNFYELCPPIFLSDYLEGNKMAFAEDGDYGYFLTGRKLWDGGPAMLHEVSLSSYKVTRSISLPSQQCYGIALAFNKLYVSDLDNSRILVYDRQTLTEDDTWPLANQPLILAIPPDKSGLFVFSADAPGGGTLEVLNLFNGNKIGDYQGIGLNSATDLEFNSDGSKVYISSTSEGVIVLNVNGN